jgi:hypothetical protein
VGDGTSGDACFPGAFISPLIWVTQQLADLADVKAGSPFSDAGLRVTQTKEEIMDTNMFKNVIVPYAQIFVTKALEYMHQAIGDPNAKSDSVTQQVVNTKWDSMKK